MLKAILYLSLVALATCQLFGGYEDADVDDEEVVSAANLAAQTLSKHFHSSFHHRLVKVVNARTQVVAGTNYKLDVIVGITNCRKNEVEYDQIEDCDFLEGVSVYKKCQVVIYKNLDGERRLVSSSCILIPKKDV